MPLGPNSYGSVAEVEALTPRWTAGGTYTAASRPMLAQVEKFIDRVSGILNVLLAEQGFTIPVSQVDAKLALDQFVVAQTSDLCGYVNSAGRFFQDKNLGTSPWSAIFKEAEDFISEHADGLGLLGATRVRAGVTGLATLLTDDAGNPIEPFFDRKQFGNRVTDWDT